MHVPSFYPVIPLFGIHSEEITQRGWCFCPTQTPFAIHSPRPAVQGVGCKQLTEDPSPGLTCWEGDCTTQGSPAHDGLKSLCLGGWGGGQAFNSVTQFPPEPSGIRSKPTLAETPSLLPLFPSSSDPPVPQEITCI